ncbi:LmeA family phospholipid-binding protein [Streptomyces sp. 6N223]|uniref:LmeA family phospholipid-binding protein n=1 Tax=Streptomyces sp. 6N223 TaxID=3457412 RepID=UPI003FCF4FBA
MRALRISLIVLGIVVVLFVVADRVALYITQGEVASRARGSLGLSEEPDVSIKGFPFLTQVAGQNLDKVTLGLDEYEALVDGETVMVTDLDLELRDTELSGGYSDAVASEASGSGVISYDALTDAYGELLGSENNGFGATFEYADGGLLLVNLQVRAMGQSLNVGSVTCEMVLEGNSITMEIVEENIPESIPGGEAIVREELETERTISELPDGLSLSSVEPTAEGIVLSVQGADVNLT